MLQHGDYIRYSQPLPKFPTWQLILQCYTTNPPDHSHLCMMQRCFVTSAKGRRLGL